jgi:hypothetical protein
MAKQGFFNTSWSDRGPAERIILLAGTGIGAIVIFRQIGKLTGFIRQTAQNVQTQGELNQWQNVGQTPSYQNTQYQIFADALLTAMQGFGTDEDAVKDVMNKMNNNADILKLIQVFGIRDGYGLSAWITDDFSAEDKEKNVNSVLRSKGITYQF